MNARGNEISPGGGLWTRSFTTSNQRGHEPGNQLEHWGGRQARTEGARDVKTIGTLWRKTVGNVAFYLILIVTFAFAEVPRCHAQGQSQAPARTELASLNEPAQPPPAGPAKPSTT